VSACGFGSGALFAKPIYAAGVDWMTLLAWRFLIGAVFSWAWLLALPGNRTTLRTLTRRRLLVLVLLGVMYVGNSGTYFAGLETVSASLAALIVYLYPALVAVMSIRFARRLEGRRAWAALAIATTGVALAVGGIDPSNAPPLLGLALEIASPIFYATWIILAARLSGERSTAETDAGAPPYDAEVPASETSAAAQPALVAAVILSATAVSWWVAALATGRPVLPSQIPSAAWMPLFGVGLVATALSFQTFYAGVRRIGAAQAALVSTVEPIWTIALATFLFGEHLGPIQLVGGALVIAGVLLAQTRR
jgi:drug/metabolite transporter (DMT)-like permease